MKILQVYAVGGPFKRVRFNEKFNVVLGKVTNPKNLDVDTHNLGKSLLIQVIDFLLLKSMSKGFFLVDQINLFREYVFFGEFLLNDGRCVTVRRSVDNNTKISIKIHAQKYLSLEECEEWDFVDLPLHSKNSSQNPIEKINLLFGFNVLGHYTYRSTIGYFFRTQSDYQDIFRLSKFAGKHKDWKPIVFEMFGFNGKILNEKYLLDEELIKKQQFIVQAKESFYIQPEEVDKLNSLIQVKENEKEILQRDVDNFSFHAEDFNVNTQLVGEVEEKISELNATAYGLSFEIEKLEASLQNKVSFDLSAIEEIFREVQLYFPEDLKRTYAELIQFNSEIFDDRKKYIEISIDEKKRRLDRASSDLVEYDKLRSGLLAQLKEKDTFLKYKHRQKQVIAMELEVSDLRNQLDKMQVVKTLQEHLVSTENKIQDLKNLIQLEIESGNADYGNIKHLFSCYVKYITNELAILATSVNGQGNVEYTADYIDEVNKLVTAKSGGYTYYKILCACFDMAILSHYSSRSFCKTVYHDGVLECLEQRKRRKYIDVVRELSNSSNVQYIMTAIQDDVPVVNGQSYFKDEEIALILDDRESSEGKLFEFSF